MPQSKECGVFIVTILLKSRHTCKLHLSRIAKDEQLALVTLVLESYLRSSCPSYLTQPSAVVFLEAAHQRFEVKRKKLFD